MTSYRCSGGRSGGREAWPNHGHHGGSNAWCPGLTQRQTERKRDNKTQSQPSKECVCVWDT